MCCRDFLLYSVSSSVIRLALRFADKNSIAADNLNILPANAYTLPFAAKPPIFWLTVNNKRNHPAAATVHLNITYKPYTATV